MTFEFFLFYLFFLFSIFSALMVISLTNAVHAVLFLILVFCNITFLLLLLGAEFFSFLLLIVYIGAIAVLFLFVIMMLNIKIEKAKVNIFFFLPVISFVFICLGENFYNFTENFDLLNLFEVQTYWISWFNEITFLSNVKVIGNVLYTDYCLLFLLASLILLVAMIGVIVLTMHQKLNLKKQKIEFQLIEILFRVAGFEPTIFYTQSKHVSHLRYTL
uniref:NADH-ubiquinone oxidoreductase chain 6 n=1 Tax=Dasya binghamiae TaxID=1896963 RepID=A0A1C8XRS7_9FLOR|nr:NADH dehydrogenase subunit 6 [Dasya binghamiae]AOH77189.1 NADH dehydrogenase subunit 6 [Dasya binghamiae]